MNNTAYSAQPVMERVTQAFLGTLASQGGLPLHRLSVAGAREFMRDLQGRDVDRAPVDIEDHTIALGSERHVGIRVVRPQRRTRALPAVIYFHGGGWVFGDKDTHDRLIREIAVTADVAVVFVEYSRSPEVRYPVAVEEAFGATRWIAAHGGRLNLDPTRIVVAGDSAGGNLAAVTALMCNDYGGPDLRLQVLFYPVTDAAQDAPSYHLFTEGAWLARRAVKWFWDSYAPDLEVRSIPTASPLRASVDQMQGLPPALVITAECDIVRDEGEAYARKLMQAGVPVTATRYLGMIHDFINLNSLANTPATRAALAQACNAIRLSLH